MKPVSPAIVPPTIAKPVPSGIAKKEQQLPPGLLKRVDDLPKGIEARFPRPAPAASDLPADSEQTPDADAIGDVLDIVA